MPSPKVDGQLFLCVGGFLGEKKEGGKKKILKNKWFSVWMDLSETISSVYTPAVGTRSAWASWPAGSGGDEALRVTSVHKWLPIRKGEGGESERRGASGREEAQCLVLLKLWEDVDDTWRHQLTMIRISEQFAVAGEEKRGDGWKGSRGVSTQFYQFLSGRRGLPSWLCQP